jgi:hypothetical protein
MVKAETPKMRFIVLSGVRIEVEVATRGKFGIEIVEFKACVGTEIGVELVVSGDGGFSNYMC